MVIASTCVVEADGALVLVSANGDAVEDRSVFAAGQLSSALSGLLAFAISFMDGFAGWSGWRRPFLIEGLPAIILSFVALFCLPDYPETARMLKEEDRTVFIHGLISIKVSDNDENWSERDLGQMSKDPTLYSLLTDGIAHGIGGFGINYALPTVIYELGLTTVALSQLMNIPPYVSVILFLNTMGHMLHKKWIMPWSTAVSIESTLIICYVILVTVASPVVRYLPNIVAVACASSADPVIWPERIRALDGNVAAGIGIGLTNAMVQFGGIVGPRVYSTVVGPRYHVSYETCSCVLVVAVTAITLSWFLIIRKNRHPIAKPASVDQLPEQRFDAGQDVKIPSVGTVVASVEL